MRPIRGFAVVAAFVFVFTGCASHADDTFVSVVRTLRQSVVLLTMKVPPEKKQDQYDDAFATGVVVASGPWGSDILTVDHAVEGAWDMRVTVDNHRKVPAAIVAENKNLDIALVRTGDARLPIARLGTSSHLDRELGREIGLLGYPIPDAFDDEGLGLQTSLNSGRLSSVRKEALEVTLPIVPGESGAPIFIADSGTIVGIAESRFEEERSIGFALPIDSAKQFLHTVDAEHGF